VDGVDYHFLEPAEFERRVREGDFLEHVAYAGNRYGTLRSEVERITAEGRSALLELELRGARAVRSALPEAVGIFIAPPSMEELSRRLERRATDTVDEIAERLRVSRTEIEAAEEFDHLIINVDVETAVRDLEAALRAAIGDG
jgi:guanylate kinase